MLTDVFSKWRQSVQSQAALAILLLLSLLALIVVPVWAAPGRPEEPFPTVLPLPNGFRPEGIVSGRGADYYVGSLADGTVYRGNLRTGMGGPFVTPDEGRIAVGLAYDPRSNYLFVAGGTTGQAYVYDASTGDDVAVLQLAAPGAGFVNDVIVTPSAAYFTNSFQAVLYRVPLTPHGRLPDPAEKDEITLPDDFAMGGFAANGIEATPDGRLLIVVHSGLGALYRFDTRSGAMDPITLQGGPVSSGDGLLLEGRTLYVVQNFLNQIAVVELDPDLASGQVVEILMAPDLFRIPTTVGGFGDSLYAVNARFDVPSPGPDTEYEVVRVAKP